MGCQRRATKTLPLLRLGEVDLMKQDPREGHQCWTTPLAAKSRLSEVSVRVVGACELLLWLLSTTVSMGGGRRINDNGGLVALGVCKIST